MYGPDPGDTTQTRGSYLGPWKDLTFLPSLLSRVGPLGRKETMEEGVTCDLCPGDTDTGGGTDPLSRSFLPRHWSVPTLSVGPP